MLESSEQISEMAARAQVRPAWMFLAEWESVGVRLTM